MFWHFLTIGLRTRRFSEPTVWLPRAAKHWKSRVFREFVTFSLPRIFFLLLLSLVWPSFFWPFLFWLFAVTWLHLWASRSKLPSNISSIALSATYVLDESCILTCCPSDSVLLLCYPNVILGSTKGHLYEVRQSLYVGLFGALFAFPAQSPTPQALWGRRSAWRWSWSLGLHLASDFTAVISSQAEARQRPGTALPEAKHTQIDT